MDGYAAPFAVVPGEGVVAGYSSKLPNGTPYADGDTTVDESALVVGPTTELYFDGTDYYEAAIIMRIDDLGETSWIKILAGNDTVFYTAATVDADGNIYVAGSHHTNVEPDLYPPMYDFGAWVDNASDGYGGGHRDIWVAKLDADGNTICIEVAGTHGGDELRDVDVDADGNVILVGYTDLDGNAGGDTPVAPRDANTRTFIAKVGADGKLIGFENYSAMDLSIFSSAVILADGSVVTFGTMKMNDELTQDDYDFMLDEELLGTNKLVGLITMIEFVEDKTAPTIASIPVIIVEEGLGSEGVLNEITDTIFEELIFDYMDDVDANHLISYMVTGTVDFDTVGEYTLTFTAYDMRGNASVGATLTVHVVAENFNEDGTTSLSGVDVVVADMGDSDLDLTNDNSAFDVMSGSITIGSEVLVAYYYDMNDPMFDLDVPSVYNMINVFGNENYFVVVDRLVSMFGIAGFEDGVTYDEAVRPLFAGEGTLNGEAFVSGDEITAAGNYEFVWKETSESTPVTISFTITSGTNVTDEATYISSKLILFNGEATLNGEPIMSGEEADYPGVYTLVITGPGSYEETYSFTVTSGANVIDGEEYDDVLFVIFRGRAELNGFPFINATQLSEPGDYVLVVQGLEDYEETIEFSILTGFSGVEDGDVIEVGGKVTLSYNLGDAVISLNGADAVPFDTSDRFEEPGLYVVTISGANGYEEVYEFVITPSCGIDEDVIEGQCVLVCEDGFHEENGECVIDPLVCEDGFHVEDDACVADELTCEDPQVLNEAGDECVDPEPEPEPADSTGCFGAIGAGSLVIAVVGALGGGALYFVRRKETL
jgi:hypothetical protein